MTEIFKPEDLLNENGIPICPKCGEKMEPYRDKYSWKCECSPNLILVVGDK